MLTLRNSGGKCLLVAERFRSAQLLSYSRHINIGWHECMRACVHVSVSVYVCVFHLRLQRAVGLVQRDPLGTKAV